MLSKRTTILGINPGTRYIGFAVLKGSVLIEWGVSVIGADTSQNRSEDASQITSRLITQYEPSILAFKKLHPSRRSASLQMITDAILKTAEREALQVRCYPIEDIERLVSPDERVNKKRMAELVRRHYPALRHALRREQDNLNPYHIRMFEAVALAMAARAALEESELTNNQ